MSPLMVYAKHLSKTLHAVLSKYISRSPEQYLPLEYSTEMRLHRTNAIDWLDEFGAEQRNVILLFDDDENANVFPTAKRGV